MIFDFLICTLRYLNSDFSLNLGAINLRVDFIVSISRLKWPASRLDHFSCLTDTSSICILSKKKVLRLHPACCCDIIN